MTDIPADAVLKPRVIADVVPLTFCQQSHFSVSILDSRRAVRNVAAAFRLSGRLNIVSLSKCFTELIRRHEALHTRISETNGVRRHEIVAPCEFNLDPVDLTAVERIDRDEEAKRLVSQFVKRRIDVSVDPLFDAVLIRLEESEHVLLVAMEHCIADAQSLRLICWDLFSMYVQEARGLQFSLPEVSIQFADYAVWLRKSEQWWTIRNGSYWKERLAGAQRIRLYGGENGPSDVRSKWKTQSIVFGGNIIAGLREVGREQKTSLAMCMLAAYIAALSHWASESDVVVRFRTLGRSLPKLRYTVGCFVSILFVRVRIQSVDRLVDLVRRTAEEYRVALKHDDHGRIDAQMPRQEISWNPTLNWIPAELSCNVPADELGSLDEPIQVRSFDFDRDHASLEELEFGFDLGISLREGNNGGVNGTMVYRAASVSLSAMACFRKRFISVVEQMAECPDVRIGEGSADI